MAKKKVADLLVEVLAEAGVRQIYGVSGDSLNGITDSIRAKKQIQWIHVRHEETAAFAAGAEAHLTGRLAVCAGSCGPGNLHLINGLYDCHRSRVPVLAIAAQIPSNEIGSGYFQETHPEQLFAQCSHYCELVSQPEQMPRVLEIAMQTAISRRGVAVVVLPGDVAMRDTVEQGPRLHFPQPKPNVCPSDDELATLAKVLNNSKRITILGGAGCAGAHAELIALAGQLNAPIVHAMRGKEFIEALACLSIMFKRGLQVRIELVLVEFRQKGAYGCLRISDKAVVDLCAPAQLFSTDINLNNLCILGIELLVRKVRSDH